MMSKTKMALLGFGLALYALGFFSAHAVTMGWMWTRHDASNAELVLSHQCIVRSMEVQERCAKSFSELKAQIDRLR